MSIGSNEVIPPEPSVRTGSRQMSRWLWTIGIVVVLAGVLVYVFQNSQYLKTRALAPGADQLANSSSQDTTPVDDYTKIEAYCASQKEAHITECGDGFPEDDYKCRTQEADEEFQTCMGTTKIEDIPDSNYQDSADTTTTTP